jgi:AcrR family transcriptional regulator
MKRTKANAELRELARRHCVNLYELAAALGVSDSTIYRWFRTEMPEDLYREVYNAIYDVGSVPPEERR